MTVLITLTTAGSSTGPFNLYSDLDGFSVPFETGVSKAALVAGYTSTLVPYGTSYIRVVSFGTCNVQTDILIGDNPSTTTTTSTSSSTTTTTTTTGILGECVELFNNEFPTVDRSVSYYDINNVLQCRYCAPFTSEWICIYPGTYGLIQTYASSDCTGGYGFVVISPSATNCTADLDCIPTTTTMPIP